MAKSFIVPASEWHCWMLRIDNLSTLFSNIINTLSCLKCCTPSSNWLTAKSCYCCCCCYRCFFLLEYGDVRVLLLLLLLLCLCECKTTAKRYSKQQSDSKELFFANSFVFLFFGFCFSRPHFKLPKSCRLFHFYFKSRWFILLFLFTFSFILFQI